MKRAILATAALSLGVFAAMAASPKIEAALKSFRAIAADPAKLKTYCAMDSAMEAAAEKKDKSAQGKVDTLMKQLGPDFKAAYEAGEDLDDNSADGKAYVAGLEALSSKCP